MVPSDIWGHDIKIPEVYKIITSAWLISHATEKWGLNDGI